MFDKKVLCLIVLVLAILLQIVAVSIPDWKNVPLDGAGAKGHEGLWERCLTSQGNSNCVKLHKPVVSKALDAVRGLVISSIVLVALSLLVCFMGNNKLGKLLLVLAVIVTVVASIVYGADKEVKPAKAEDLGVAYWLNVAGGVLALVAVFL